MNRIISESNITIEGQEFTGNLSARMSHPDGRPYHTFRTYTLLVDGSNVTFKNAFFQIRQGRGRPWDRP